MKNISGWLGWLFCEFSFRWFNWFDSTNAWHKWRWVHQASWFVGNKAYRIGCYFYDFEEEG